MICHCTKENLGLSLSPVSYRHTSVSVYSVSGFTILHDLVKSKKQILDVKVEQSYLPFEYCH